MCGHFNIEDGRKYFGILCLYYFKKGKNATEMQKEVCAVYGEGTVTDQTCRKWLVKFHTGDVCLDDAPWSGRPVEVDSDQVKTSRTINVIPRGREPTYSKYPNQ